MAPFHRQRCCTGSSCQRLIVCLVRGGNHRIHSRESCVTWSMVVVRPSGVRRQPGRQVVPWCHAGTMEAPTDWFSSRSPLSTSRVPLFIISLSPLCPLCHCLRWSRRCAFHVRLAGGFSQVLGRFQAFWSSLLFCFVCLFVVVKQYKDCT